LVFIAHTHVSFFIKLIGEGQIPDWPKTGVKFSFQRIETLRDQRIIDL